MRIIQGFGFGLVAIAAPSAIGQFIPREKMSIAMGIWSAWIPFSSMAMFFFAPKIVLYFPLNTYWILLMVITLLGFVAFARIIPRKITEKADAFIPAKTHIIEELKNANLWWAGTGFAAYSLTFLTFNTWIPTVLVESASIPLASATFVPALLAIFAIWSNVFAGVIYKKSGYPLVLFMLPPLAIACLWPMFTMEQPMFLYSSAIIIGCLGANRNFWHEDEGKRTGAEKQCIIERGLKQG
jgi:MFS family permease